MVLAVVEVCHLLLAAVWAGSMAYSLTVVQPAVGTFFGDDDEAREVFLATLANGNRWRVLGLAGGIVATAATVVAGTDRTAVRAAYATALALYVVAVGVFAEVSWRHWPARVFALPHERAGFRAALRRRAWTMAVLVGTAFVLALAAGVFQGR